MAYKKMKRPMMQRRAPLMFGGPTPVNMAPAMAGCCGGTGEYIAVGADGEEIAMPPVYHEGILGKMSTATAVKLAAVGALAYYFLKKKR